MNASVLKFPNEYQLKNLIPDMAAYDDLNVKRIFTVGIASVVVTAVTALAVQVLYYSMVQWQDAETKAASDYSRQNSILTAQEAEISNYGVNEETGNIIIPIDKAIELLVSEKTKSSSDSNHSSKTVTSTRDVWSSTPAVDFSVTRNQRFESASQESAGIIAAPIRATLVPFSISSPPLIGCFRACQAPVPVIFSA